VWVQALEEESALPRKQLLRWTGPALPVASRYVQCKLLHTHGCIIKAVEIEAAEELTHHQNRSRGPKRDLHRVSWAEAEALAACTPKGSRRGPPTGRLRLEARPRRGHTSKSHRLERPRRDCVSTLKKKHPLVAAAPPLRNASEQWPPTHLDHRQSDHPLLPLASRKPREEAGNSQQAPGSARKRHVLHES